ncbi:hypothetical protein [Inhella proteolytica]|uniref:Uncharacterized protein n=1 Tax=Inhella proteolytica TaxID=2795029 RepID=A0A931NFD8_9BURK|nr:hypothetical protein [Inhella proteolytica]MBH9578672.1 hypothetical protein [Inhella proteolytica]
MKALLATVVLGATLPVFGLMLLLVLIKAPWALLALAFILAAVWPFHRHGAAQQAARGADSVF